MKLREILKGTDYKIINGSEDIDIGKIETDSRKIGKGDLFIALTGIGADGHNYIESAVKAGAAAVVAEHECSSFGAALIVTYNSRILAAYAAANY